jgi:hypothetical protein
MAFSKERKITTITVSPYEKHRLSSYFGSSNFSENFRRILNSTPLLIDEQTEGFLVASGVQNPYDHDEMALAAKEALFWAVMNGFNLENRENLFYEPKELKAKNDNGIDHAGIDAAIANLGKH